MFSTAPSQIITFIRVCETSCVVVVIGAPLNPVYQPGNINRAGGEKTPASPLAWFLSALMLPSCCSVACMRAVALTFCLHAEAADAYPSADTRLPICCCSLRHEGGTAEGSGGRWGGEGAFWRPGEFRRMLAVGPTATVFLILCWVDTFCAGPFRI